MCGCERESRHIRAKFDQFWSTLANILPVLVKSVPTLAKWAILFLTLEKKSREYLLNMFGVFSGRLPGDRRCGEYSFECVYSISPPLPPSSRGVTFDKLMRKSWRCCISQS